MSQLCTDLDGMFNEVAEIFKKKQLNTEVDSVFATNQLIFLILACIPAEEGVV